MVVYFDKVQEKSELVDWSKSCKKYYDSVNPKYINWDLYKRYLDVEPNFGQIGLVVFLRTYSRFIPFLNRREKWSEICLRVVEYSMSLDTSDRTYSEKLSEAYVLFDYMFNLRILPAGRTLWVGGTKIVEKDGTANFNCSACTINEISVFAEGFYVLLVGCGFGFSVEKKYVEQLPKFYKDKTIRHLSYQGWKEGQDNTILTVHDNSLKRNTLDFAGLDRSSFNYTDDQFTSLLKPYEDCSAIEIKVGDSKEGWTNALRAYLTCFTLPNLKNIIINYDHVRPEGSLLKTFGGRSSGHGALQQLFERIQQFISQSEFNGQQLTPLQVMDICNAMGMAVVVGGTRRSSELCMADYDDQSIRDAKNGLWEDPNVPITRSMSNNSLVLYENPGLEWFQEVMGSVRQKGEPGFISVGNVLKRDPSKTRKLFNPCFTGDTMVMTKDGHYRIDQLVGKSVDIWDGNQWVNVNNFRVTGQNEEVWEITFHNGQKLKATPYHTFITEDDKRVELRDLSIGTKLKSTDVTVHGDKHIEGAYLKGFMLGDGSSSSERAILAVYEPKEVCIPRLEQSLLEVPVGNVVTNGKVEIEWSQNKNYKVMSGITVRDNERDIYKYATEYRKGLPSDILNWDYISKCEFIAGLFDADGTVVDGKNGFSYQFTSISLKLLEDLQVLLNGLGVKSKVSLNIKSKLQNFGEERGGIYQTQNVYRLTIPQASSVKLSQQVKFSRLKSFSDREPAYKVKDNSWKIVDIKPCGIADKVYCCTVPTNNSFTLSVGLVVGNCVEICLDNRGTCNLTENYLPKFLVEKDGEYTIDWERLETALRLTTRMGSRITLVEMFHDEWNKVQERDRLLGVSISGVVEFFEALNYDEVQQTEFYERIRKIVKDEADKYHDKLGINRSLLKTTIKPSGTLSSLVGCGSGIHRLYAPYHYRRVRVSKNDPICKALLDLGLDAKPENGQGYDINGENVNTLVFTFVVKNNTLIGANDESAIEQLERYKLAVNHYTDHNVSFTCTVGEDEWNKVANWLYENYDSFIGVSFLPKFDSTNSPYPQLPYETINKETYDEYLKTMPKFTENEFIELLTKYEKTSEEYDLLDADCVSGLCPTR